MIRTRDPKISYGFGVTVTYARSVGFVYFAIRIVQSRLSWYLWQASFPMCFLVFTKICLINSLLNKYPPCWSFKLAKSNQFKVDISPGQDWREMQISARSALFEKLNASLTTKHLENTHRFGRCSILNTLNLGKWGVRIHNCAVLLDFLALFGYTERILLFSRISPDNCLKTCSKACGMEWLCNDTSFRLTWKHAWEMAEKEKWGK